MQHVVRLVDDLLDVSRITRGKSELRRKQVCISDVVAKAIEIASPILESRAQRLHTKVVADLQVDGDEVRLSQVVANLLTNAAKHSPSGADIHIVAALEDHMVVVRVRDNGAGIAPELLPRLFDLFVQGEQTGDRARGGLGLGLTIVKSLTELHGGTVSASSQGPNQGSEFIVRLPPAPVASGARAPERVPSQTQPTLTDGLRVLIVDDNRDAADLLAEALAAIGHVPFVAYDGPTALALAPSVRPDIALLDIGLPVMDGCCSARPAYKRGVNAIMTG